MHQPRMTPGLATSGIFLLVLAAVMLLPFVWMVLSAFKTSAEIHQLPPTFFPAQVSLRNLGRVLFEAPFFTWLGNSLLVAVFTTAASVFTSVLAGYVFARFQFKGKEVYFIILLSTMMIPFPAILIPTYVIVKTMGLLNTLASLVLPFVVTAFGIFLARNFCADIPSDTVEAARIDGASEWTVFFRVMMPQLQPVVASLAIFNFMASWNNYLWPLIAINDKGTMTVPLALTYYSSQRLMDIGAMMSASLLIMLPVVVVFLVFQRRFIEGMAMSGIKG